MAVLAPSLASPSGGRSAGTRGSAPIAPWFEVRLRLISVPFQKMMPFGFGILNRFREISVPVGEPVDPERLALIPPGDPLRLLRVDRELWTQCLEADVAESETIDQSADVAYDDRYSDLLPEPQGEKHLNRGSK